MAGKAKRGADTSWDVAGIGNAIVDVLAHADDAFLVRNGLAKGAMTLIDAERAAELYDRMGPAVEISGGSAANTLVALASMGGRGAFIGKVRNDQLGGIFRHDIEAAGVSFATPPATVGPPTARCLIFVTADAQRTMQTYLGACAELTPADIDENAIAAAKVTYLEGYLWDPPQAKQAFLKAAKLAHESGRKVALTLSDPFCVERHREEFRDLVAHHVDILFANEHEIMSLFETDMFDDVFQHVRGMCEIAALTRSERGSVIVSGEEVHIIDAMPYAPVMDSTGAGDAYAGGFLFGLTRGYDLAQCGRLASLAAGEVISHFGARPEVPLAELAAERLP
ncbi:MAG TPA: adenosine kinase [Alphaproteobacteria bacterium]|nr:adenosine kinase [Alphaproteobacteria bacterium]